MSETPRHLKSSDIRKDWKNILDAVQNGEEIVVELYNRPIAKIVPYEEPTMTVPRISAADIRDLANADFSDLAVLAIDNDGDLWLCPQSTAQEHHARIVTDADAVEAYTGGVKDEYTADLYAAFADELNAELAQQ
jgi:antitoxin (DNA-binding transcriptional repressor) of toxin-antitoxin stability system